MQAMPRMAKYGFLVSPMFIFGVSCGSGADDAEQAIGFPLR